MTRRARDLLHGVAAVAVLTAVILGVPVALAVGIGWPLPRGLPSWDELSRALTNGDVADTTWLKAIACVVWIAWADFALAVAVEIIASAHGRTAPPVAVIAGPARVAAGRLVAGVALVVASLAPRIRPRHLRPSRPPPPSSICPTRPLQRNPVHSRSMIPLPGTRARPTPGSHHPSRGRSLATRRCGASPSGPSATGNDGSSCGTSTGASPSLAAGP